MHRFLSYAPLQPELILSEGAHFHQITHVFRAKKGQQLVFFEAGWPDIIYEIENISKKTLHLKQIAIANRRLKKNKELRVFQAYPNKIPTMETLVQKLVEIGVGEIVFFASEHSQLADIPDAKKRRLQAIADEALEQSGGNVPLSIRYASEDIGQLLDQHKHASHIIGFPGASQGLPSLRGVSGLSFWVGPEGWWSIREKMLFEEKDCSLWAFNDNTLRLETASIVGTGILAYLTWES